MITPSPQPRSGSVASPRSTGFTGGSTHTKPVGQRADCPFDPDASVTDFFLAHWWTKGWRRARDVGANLDLPGRPSAPSEQPPPTKHGASSRPPIPLPDLSTPGARATAVNPAR